LFVGCVKSGHVLRLTLLSPDNVDAIDDVRHQSVMTLAVLMRRFAVGWDSPSLVGDGCNR
jgi:hypothetical protein